MERRLPGPSRPAGALRPAQDVRALLFSPSWVVTGAIGLVLVVGVGTLMSSEGLALYRRGIEPRGWRLYAGPARLFGIYGIAFLFAWPAVFVLGMFRRSVDDATAARFSAHFESQRARVQVTLLVTAFLAIAAGWAAAVAVVVSKWPAESHTLGSIASCALLSMAALLAGRSAVRLARGGDHSPS